MNTSDNSLTQYAPAERSSMFEILKEHKELSEIDLLIY